MMLTTFYYDIFKFCVIDYYLEVRDEVRAIKTSEELHKMLLSKELEIAIIELTNIANEENNMSKRELLKPVIRKRTNNKRDHKYWKYYIYKKRPYIRKKKQCLV